jgi:hypothetical protein
MLAETQVSQFWRDGYLRLPGILSPAEAEHYRRVIVDLLPRDATIPPSWEIWQGRIKPYWPSGDDCYDLPELLPLFGNEKLYAIMSQLLESPRLRVYDGSIGITLRDDADPGGPPRTQPLHLDTSVPVAADFTFKLEEVQLGGCFYFTDVVADGGGIHVVPGGHRAVEEEARAHPDGRRLHENWKRLGDLDSVEVTGSAGDFMLLHHLMPHAASRNRQPTARVALFLRYVRTDQTHGYGSRPPRVYNAAQLDAMTPLGRRLAGLDPWD